MSDAETDEFFPLPNPGCKVGLTGRVVAYSFVSLAWTPRTATEAVTMQQSNMDQPSGEGG